MIDSSDHTRNYLLAEFKKQYFENRDDQGKAQADYLKDFLIKAGVI